MSIDDVGLLDRSKRYRSDRYPGVALVFDEPEMETVLEEVMSEDYSHILWYEEEEVPTGMAIMHMVGDDARLLIDPDELDEIEIVDYCPGCGQIGCDWG